MPAPDSTRADSSYTPEDVEFLARDICPAIFDHMLNGVACCRMLFENGRPYDFVYLYTNPAFHKQTGLGPVSGKRLTEVLPGIRETTRLLFEISGRVAASGAAEIFETFVEPLNQWLAIQIFSPRPGYFVAILDVITERKEAEAALSERDSRYRAVVETSSDGFWVVDRGGHLLDVNEAYVRRSGYTREELLQKRVVDLEARESAADVAVHIDTIMSKGADIFETLHRAKDNTTWPVEVTVRHRSDRPGQILCFLRDITERKRIEEERKRSAETLEAVMSQLTMVEERERRAIATDLHDGISQLLAVAKLKLRLLPKLDDSGDSHQSFREAVEVVEQAERSARSLSFQISPPLLFELGLVPALQSLAEELHKIYRLAATVNDDGKPKDLAPTTRSVLYRATRELLINVAKHAKVKVAHVDVRTDNGLVVISVTDSGVGFDKRLVENHAPGSGFGLVSMRERLRLIGGQFDIDTHPGDGTVATLAVPSAGN